MRTARIVLPKVIKRGEIIEIKTLINHVMETGYRRDDMGLAIPRDIFKTFAVTYNGTEIFRAELFSGVAANPYFAFTTVATESGTLEFTWTDEKGVAHVEKTPIAVT
jgi:sulfur-oxidizing protein SoxZ